MNFYEFENILYNNLFSKPLQPSSIYIKSGNFSENRENIKYIRTIHIHPKFSYRTMENDIALLQVNKNYLFNLQYQMF